MGRGSVLLRYITPDNPADKRYITQMNLATSHQLSERHHTAHPPALPHASQLAAKSVGFEAVSGLRTKLFTGLYAGLCAAMLSFGGGSAAYAVSDSPSDPFGGLTRQTGEAATHYHLPPHPENFGSMAALENWLSTEDVLRKRTDGQEMFIPLQRPYPAVAWGGEPAIAELPASRPNLEDLLPLATRQIAEFAKREADLTIIEEDTLSLKKGETLAVLLKRAGMSPSAQAPLVSALSRRLNPRRLQIGMDFTTGKNANGDVVALQFGLKNARSYYLLQDAELGWFGLQAIRPIDTMLVHATAVIDGTLYDTATAALVPPATLEEFVRVMGFSVDFQRQLRLGDSFALVYERAVDRLTGKELSAGDLQYASMSIAGERLHFFRHEHLDGQVGWYDETGDSAVRTLMRTPVNGARVSSSYGMRKHPIKGYNAMHRGVDFAVPTGTPILAAGTGKVELAGWNGSYGRYIRIRHNGTYKTAYAHLSRIASGVRAGAQVRQGQVIGFVGSTGRSTGPHLHYEIIVNNRKVNPMTIKLPTGKGLEGRELFRFRSRVSELAELVGPVGKTQFAEKTE